MSEEKCKFYKKQFLSNYCELFKQPCYGKHCNFIKEFTRLNELEQQLQTAKEENEKLNKLHAFLHNKFNWSKEDVWIRNYLSSYIFDEEMVSDGKEYISPLKQILDLTQQNKQMREALSWLETLLRENYNDEENQINCVAFAYEKIQQSLNEVNNEK